VKDYIPYVYIDMVTSTYWTSNCYFLCFNIYLNISVTTYRTKPQSPFRVGITGAVFMSTTYSVTTHTHTFLTNIIIFNNKTRFFLMPICMICLRELNCA